MRLFCFPNAGGGAALLHLWLNGLPAAIDMCPILLPGRDRRRADPPFVRMDTLVRSVCQDLQPLMDRPFALFGHSLGALVAFEVARELQQQDLTPLRLFVSARAAPQTPRSLPPIHQRPDQEFVDELILRYDAIPPSIAADKDLMTIFMPILRADLEILETYRYQHGVPLACPISVLGGVMDPTVANSELEAWTEQTSSSFRMHLFPGKHFFLKEARPQVLKAICNDLSVGFSAD
jgi:surfactin synthase thioesterase subunit